MMVRWAVVGWENGQWFATQGRHVHPIPFDTEREARRAVDRLNVRDERVVSFPHE